MSTEFIDCLQKYSRYIEVVYGVFTHFLMDPISYFLSVQKV